VIAIIGLLVSLLLPALAASRKSARTSICQSNMRQMFIGLQNYAGDGKGLIASFTWQPRVWTPSIYPDNQQFPTRPAEAFAYQAVEIVRQLAHDPSIVAPDVAKSNLVARNFTQLVLMHAGSFGGRNPEPAIVCPEDRDALEWQRLTPNEAIARLGT